jgi:hypothetical protein
MVLAHALSRAHRYPEAVEVLDRASSALDSCPDELALQLDAAAVLPALNDPVTAPSVGLRYETLRERAAGDPAAPPEVLAAVAFISVLSNEPAEIGADLATRALLAEDSARPGSKGRPWFSFAAWFSQTTFSLLLAERYAEARPLLDASIAQARITGDGGRLAVGLRDRGWLALRRGDLSAAEGCSNGARATELRRRPPPMNGACTSTLVTRASSMRRRRRSRFDSEAGSSPPPGGFASPRTCAGRTSSNREGLEDFLGRADLTRAMSAAESYLPWRLGPRSPSRARRSRIGGTARRRGARARTGIWHITRDRRREARRRHRCRR